MDKVHLRIKKLAFESFNSANLAAIILIQYNHTMTQFNVQIKNFIFQSISQIPQFQELIHNYYVFENSK